MIAIVMMMMMMMMMMMLFFFGFGTDAHTVYVNEKSLGRIDAGHVIDGNRAWYSPELIMSGVLYYPARTGCPPTPSAQPVSLSTPSLCECQVTGTLIK